MKNEIYDNMLSAYGATTEQERRNAIFEVNQQVYLPDSTMAVSLMLPLSMAVLVSEFFMASNASADGQELTLDLIRDFYSDFNL